MISDNPEVGRTSWRGRVETFALLIAACLSLVLGVFFAASSGFRDSDGIVPELDGRINPNDASVASLVRLPGIGFSKATAIVTYREELRATGVDRAFSDLTDIQKVKGIGPKTAEGVGGHLRFE